MTTEGLPPDRVSQELRRQTLSQLEEAIRNYPGTPGATQHNLQNPTDLEHNLFEQSRTAEEYTAKLQRILFMLTKRKSLQNLASQNPAQQQQGTGPTSLPQSSNLQPPGQQPHSLTQFAGGGGGGGGVSYSVSGSNMAGVNPAGMGMARPMQPGIQPGVGGYQGYQGQQMHPSHPHYPPHMHRGMGGAMQPGMHPAQRPMMGGAGGQGMMHGAYGHAHNPMGVHNYPQASMNYQPHFNPAGQMHVGMPQRQPSINPSLMRPQPTPMAHGMGGVSGMMPHGMGMGRGGMLGGGAAGMARMGGAYGGPVVHQVQSGYSASDIGGSVQPVMAVPNPSYLPSSSGAGIRQPAPPYDSVGPPASSAAPPLSSVLNVSSSAPSLPPSSSSAVTVAVSSSAPSLPHSTLPPPHPPTTSAPLQTTTTASNLLQSQPVPSPAPPPTPLLPASPATSVGSPAHTSVTPEENEAYLRTHHELQVYLPLLTRMMNRTLKKEGEDAHKSEQYMKLKSLHSLLQDDKKRVPLPTLIKCKVALEKMFEQQQLREHLDSTSSHPAISNPPSVAVVAPLTPATPAATPNPTVTDPPIPPSTKPLPEPKSQSLLEFKMIPSPTPTLGNLAESCSARSHPFPADRLPPAKRLCNRAEPAISPGLRREIAHLVGFKVHPLPREKADRGTMLECSIMDEDLPKVPSLTVCIPPGYPKFSPECNLESYRQDSTPLLSEVGERLSKTLASCCGSYTLSFLLSTWETSLLKTLSAQLN